MIPFEQEIENAESHRKQRGLPLVTLSYAQSLDGSIAAASGEPLTLSGPESKFMTHQLRALHDAILVGIGTVIADDPRLTTRLAQGKNPQPVILDSSLRFPLDANLLRRHENFPWIATTEKAELDRQTALEKAGARILHFPQDDRGCVPLCSLLQRLAAEGINSLMVEGGTRVISAFLSAGLVDQAVITIAPRFIGGLPAVDFSESESSLRAPGYYLCEMKAEMLGRDLVIWGEISGEGES